MADKKGSSFYEELIKADFYQSSTKQASSNEEGLSKEAAKSMLDSFSSDQLEALAQEFDDMIGKTASTSTLEDDILEVLAEEDGKKEFPFKKKEKEDKKEKGEKSEGSEADKKEDKKEGESEDEDEDKDEKEKKEAEVLDAQLLKEACDKALDIMTEKGLTVADYAYSRFDDREVAEFIADKAEKLAYITEQNPLIVVDDIINSIESKFSEE